MAIVDVDNGPGRARLLIEVDGELDEESAALAEIYDGAVRGEALATKVAKLSRPLFTEALNLVESCAAAVSERLDGMQGSPDEVEMELAVQMDTTVGAKIVELSGSAQMHVTLRWAGLRERMRG